MNELWSPGTGGVLRLPSGRMVRGRGWRNPMPDGPAPQFAVYPLSKPPPSVEWEFQWLKWPDFWLPFDRAAAVVAIREAWQRSEAERVEVACGGGFGRTGTVLACIAVVDGVPQRDAVAWVRENYHRRSVETPWQRRFVSTFGSRYLTD